jgi:hypothetical protein
VQRCELRLLPYGFSGSVTFLWSTDLAEDTLLAPFLTQSLATVKLTITNVVPQVDTPPDPLVVSGVVTEKGLVESSFGEVREAPVLMREYTVAFADAPRVLFGQHHPLQLAVETTVSDVIAAHVVEGTTVEVTLDAALAQRRHVFLPLGEGRASFYDFLAWYADVNGGHLVWDHVAHTLTLSAEKAPSATAVKLRGTEVERLTVRVPETLRHAARVLNSFADGPLTTDVAQAKAVAGVSKDYLVRTTVSADVDARVSLEEKRLAVHETELEVQFARYPTVAFWPGTTTELQGAHFSAGLSAQGKTYRVAEVRLLATAADGMTAEDFGSTSRRYALDMAATWELSTDTVQRLPPYVAPRWPLHVEGKVLVEVGQEGERTWELEEDTETSAQAYRVKVPLWSDVVVRAPFEPMFLPGHFYAPTFRESRVLLALSLHTAEIVSHLEWGPGVQMPVDTQGNQLLLGKSGTNQTGITHAYVDNKPVLTVLRTNDSDTELLKLEEGIMILQTKEEQ